MKRILGLVGLIILLSGCGNMTARKAVEEYLKKYNNLSSDVLVDIEKTIDKETFNNKAQEKYRDVLKKQYKDLSYEILEEEYDNEVSYITVKIEVYDLYRVNADALIYLENNESLFYNELGEYDVNKYIDYRLEQMKKTTNRVEYKLVFTVIKEDGKYVVEQPTENDLKKIHGTYNYELA